jgi:hypothetical protein
MNSSNSQETPTMAPNDQQTLSTLRSTLFQIGADVSSNLADIRKSLLSMTIQHSDLGKAMEILEKLIHQIDMINSMASRDILGKEINRISDAVNRLMLVGVGATTDAITMLDAQERQQSS